MEKELRRKILSELKEWDCIKDKYDALGITEQILKIIAPLISQPDSKRASDVWHEPDVVPLVAGPLKESVLVLSQSGEKVGYDFLSNEWFNWDNPSREAHVEKWRYPQPEPIKI